VASAGVQLRFETDADSVDEGELELLEVRGHQRLSSLYEYELTLQTRTDGGLGPERVDELLGRRCSVRHGTSAQCDLHGILRAIELVPTHEEGIVAYRATLAPRLWNTTLHRSSQVFQDMGAPDIIAAVLGEDGLGGAFSNELTGSYPSRTFTAQYRENDFAFISRLMERWGIFYFFEQTPDGERLVLADANAVAQPHPDHVVIHHSVGDSGQSRDQSIREVSRRHEVQPERVEVVDYNYRTPSVPVSGASACDAVTGRGSQVFYGEHAKDGGEASRFASIRAQARMAGREVYRMSSSVEGIAPGHRFELADHVLPQLCRDYLVVGVDHVMRRGANAIEAQLTAIPLEVPFRAPITTEWPRIRGFMHGTIDGAPGAAAPVDDQGRYLCKIPYDMAGGAASRWVRMAQSSAGPGYGMHLPLHAGTEVAIVHLDGDPDRPIIVGAIPNPSTTSPVTAANATQSKIKTRAGILIRFEDDA